MGKFKTDTIKLHMDIREHEYDNKTYYYLNTTATINNKIINFYTDHEAFLFYSKDSRGWFEKEHNLQRSSFSGFEPFTCECGIGGCAGIWDGIQTKHRKHTVEWRLNMKDGYEGLLDQTFYSFDRQEYEQEIMKIWFWLFDNAETKVHDEIYGDEDSEPEPIQNILDAYKVNHPHQVEAAYRLYKRTQQKVS